VPAAPPGWNGPFDVQTVLARAVVAAGGPDAVALPARVRSRTRVLLHPDAGEPIAGELTYWADGASCERRELVTDDGRELVQMVQGDLALEIEDGVATGRDLDEEVRVRRRYRSLLADFAAAPPRSCVLAAEPDAEPGREIVVESSGPEGERWQLWLDPATLLSTRIRRIVRRGGDDSIEEDRLFAHERFGARVVARGRSTWIDGRRRKDAWLLEFHEDVAPDPELFRLPPTR